MTNINSLFIVILNIFQKIKFGAPPNLIGDRDIEYSFIAANIPEKKGEILDFGSGGTPLSLIAELKGNDVTAFDLIKYDYNYKTKFKFIQGDILKTIQLKENYFDTIINCSSIEHVGLNGRYGITEDFPDGDLLAMTKLKDLLKKNGTMLLTIPVGKDKIVKGMHRIYGKKRLPKLLSDFSILKQIYWVKNSINQWQETTRRNALNTKGSEKYYAIGCFVLKKVIV